MTQTTISDKQMTHSVLSCDVAVLLLGVCVVFTGSAGAVAST